MSETMFETVLYELEDQIATITLNRPERLNALNGTLLRELRQALEAAASDSDARVVVLTGAGRLFSAGGDLKDGTGAEPNLEASIGSLTYFERSALLLHEMAKPTICALNGGAAGAGCSIALAADLRYMADSAYLYTAFLNVGVSGDFGGTWTLPRLVGLARAREMYLLPDKVDAETAQRLGLANGVFPADELMPSVRAIAERLRDSHPLAMGQIKANLNDAFSIPFSEALRREADRMRRLGLSEDSAEARNAFIEKRKPAFKGR